jgi:hypothetical protein
MLSEIPIVLLATCREAAQAPFLAGIFVGDIIPTANLIAAKFFFHAVHVLSIGTW